MNKYSFYAIARDGSIYKYPTYEVIEEANRNAAIYAFSLANNMRIAEVNDEDVWMELPDGAMVKYDVTEK